MNNKKYGKRRLTLLLIFAVIFTMCSCSSGETASESASTSKDDSVVEITEDFFLTQVNDIYTNAEDYMGRTIRYQGIIETSMYGEGENSQQIIYVFRNSPGCCGNDGSAGFEVLWDGEMPPQDSWIEVEGVLQSYEDKDGNKFLQLKLDSLNILEERGKEFVAQ